MNDEFGMNANGENTNTPNNPEENIISGSASETNAEHSVSEGAPAQETAQSRYKIPEPPVQKETSRYNPVDGTYTYSKQNPENSGNPVNGCVWNSEYSKKVKKIKRKALGIRVFAAVMLSVLTVSAATLAVLKVADHMDNGNAEIKSGSESAVQNQYVPQVPATTISTFTSVDSGLTKSQVAAKCKQSAVGIVIEQETEVNSYYGSFPYFGYGYSYPSGKQIVEASGSGFIYSSDGYIITNHHVVKDATKITVYLNDGSIHDAELVGSDAFSDIAVIKINADGLQLVPMEIGDSSAINVGDEVIAIGCPAGIDFMNTVTDGIISAINRDVQLTDDNSSTKKTMTLLQTNATINRGNSGGALINSKGQVIGINTLKLSSDYEGIGFSIPMNGALPIISQLIEYGKVVERSENDFVSGEGVIGISVSAITESESEYYDIPLGVLVRQIDRESSAAEAGLRRGDIITAFNGETVTTAEKLNSLKAKYKAGDEVTLTVYRDDDGTTFDISFKLDAAS